MTVHADVQSTIRSVLFWAYKFCPIFSRKSNIQILYYVFFAVNKIDWAQYLGFLVIDNLQNLWRGREVVCR